MLSQRENFAPKLPFSAGFQVGEMRVGRESEQKRKRVTMEDARTFVRLSTDPSKRTPSGWISTDDLQPLLAEVTWNWGLQSAPVSSTLRGQDAGCLRGVQRFDKWEGNTWWLLACDLW
mmetsp:Transcript_9243/g.34699  ORF Transcript_9243/g.34699 Transcript_9243/m.34699 type:complete len:118 (-) Transcript_9243:180-533(-)